MKKLLAKYAAKYNNSRLAYCGSSFEHFIYSCYELASAEKKYRKASQLLDLYNYLTEDDE